MARDGAGTYSFPVNSFNPAVAATDISPTDWNSTTADIATALTASIAKDGQTPTTAVIPFASGISLSGGSNLTTYAEVAFTPTDASGAGLTLTINGSGATKIGNLVHVWGDITFPVTADATQICIGGLPATVKNATGAGGGFGVVGLSTDFGLPVKNTTTFKVYTVVGAARPNSGYTASRFYFQFWYAVS